MSEQRPTRFDALAAVAHAFPAEPIVVALGTMVREMLLVGRSDNHLYVLDSMGLPPAIGLGLALSPAAQRFDKVIVVEGDGGMLMGLSTLATIGLLQPERLLLIVLDNGAYAATGMQRSAAPAVDFCAAAQACGMRAQRVATTAALEQALQEARHTPGPALLHVPIGPENRPAPYFLPDPVELTLAFQRFLAPPSLAARSSGAPHQQHG
jgi:thiamine pyrophosphate-dependent acetolactate synthase large subunit-like protein